jgi:UDP-N-acetylglucosamine 4,6-dehydratase
MTTNHSFLSPEPSLKDANLLVTGGTGSFGRAFVNTLLTRHKPKRLVVFSRDEQKQEDMARELQAAHPREAFETMRFFIGDVRDVSRLELAMRGVDIVVHAAALKIVPTAEYNPFECILTNVHGAENVVTAAIRAKVGKVVALSTDKAVNPINLYGASKLAADKIMVAANYLAGSEPPRFSVVRYGNVIGSRGSVVPLFEALLKRGAKVIPITDPRMTRFWITLEQGVNFVLSSLEMMHGAEIFVPKIPSMNIADLAQAIAPGLSHEVVGIRPGEKLHEVLITEDDARTTVELDDRYVICPPRTEWTAHHLEALGARPIPERFLYSSDRNPQRLDKFALMRLIGRDRVAVA